MRPAEEWKEGLWYGGEEQVRGKNFEFSWYIKIPINQWQ